MESDKVGCPCGGAYSFVKDLGALVCVDCGRHSPYQRMPSYGEVVALNNQYRKALENIIESTDNRDYYIEEARKLIS